MSASSLHHCRGNVVLLIDALEVCLKIVIIREITSEIGVFALRFC